MRWTRPPSSSTDTATGSLAAAWTASRERSFNNAVALPPMKIPPTWLSRTSDTVAPGLSPETPTTTSCATWPRTSRPLTSDAQSPGRVRLDVGAGEAARPCGTVKTGRNR